MEYEVQKLNPVEWEALSESAHKAVFNEVKPASFDRIDFALVCHTDSMPMGYVTCREYDHETVYWQFGGSFPGTKGTVLSWGCYVALTAWCLDRYKRITTLIENTNTVMIKFAMKRGFRIIGIRNFGGSILLEHLLEDAWAL